MNQPPPIRSRKISSSQPGPITFAYSRSIGCGHQRSLTRQRSTISIGVMRPATSIAVGTPSSPAITRRRVGGRITRVMRRTAAHRTAAHRAASRLGLGVAAYKAHAALVARRIGVKEFGVQDAIGAVAQRDRRTAPGKTIDAW